jgi:tetratricopeptide (TPR) repeat protein
MPHENNRPIFFCTNPKVDIGQYFRVERKIDAKFLSILRNEGAEKAIEFYKKQKAKNVKTVLFTEHQINFLGYEYLRNNLTSEAISLFKLNVEEHPESFNVYDSLGDGFMKAKKYELAVINYKRSIELNPNNTHSKNKLNELKILLGH